MAETNKNLTKDKEGEEEVVPVKKADLDRLFQTIERQTKDINILYQAGDKARIAQVRNAESGPLIHTAKAWRLTKPGKNEGKLMVAWQLVKNTSEVIGGRWVEDQQEVVFLEDGGKEELSLQEFYRFREAVVGEITKRTTGVDTKGESEITFTLTFPDGKKIDLGQNFIN